MTIARAALAYFALVFAAGFAMGTARAFLVGAGTLREFSAVLLELPVMLAVSWLAADWTMRRFAIAGRGPALAVGVSAFVLLMLAELALSVILSSPTQYLKALTAPAGALGLVGQLAFALMPFIRAARLSFARPAP